MRAATAIVMTIALAFAPATSLAQEQADASYESTISDSRAQFDVPREYGDRSGETSLVLDTEEGLLATDFAFDEAEDQAEPRLDIRLHQIVEYVDENDNGYYDSEDDVASAWRLSNASHNVTAESNGTVVWQDLEAENATSEDGVEGTRVVGLAEFPSQDPLAGVIDQLGQGENRTFGLNMTVFGEPATVDGRQLEATQAHVEWRVHNYPYTRDDTQLALVAGADSATPPTFEQGDNATQLTVTPALDGSTIALSASVRDEAVVDGNRTSVEATTVEADDENATADRFVALSYDRGDLLQQQASIGSNVSTTQSVVDAAEDEVTSVPGLTAWSALGVLAAAAALVRRG